ncbi:AMP-binding protein [Actinoallomurus soli]|uniref:AMP-binding protein n=1 Tax=Actinoallomurus soli TaxID=2952535 RepID=UPI0020937DD0|nr:AMP-binding protein [Actinoallomurus soli]MCO5974525.1 AMP-binding protein [Actinoallomurus soli]
MRTPYDDRPWLRYYAEGVPADVDVPDVPLTRLLDASADRFPGHRALEFLGRSMTYARLRDAVDRFAMALARLGVRKGDRVAVILPNCPQEVIAFYAVLRLGAVVVPTNPLYTASELRYQLADSGARVVVVFDKAYATVHEAAPGTAVQHVIVTSLPDYLPFVKRELLKLPLARARRLAAELSTEVPAEAPVLWFDDLLKETGEPHPQAMVDPFRDLAVLQYTGGTTGRPKGAMLTHRNLVANALQTTAWDPGIRQGQDVALAVVPLFHVFGLTFCLTCTILIGGTVVLVPRFDLELVLDAVRKHKPTLFPGVPPLFQQLAAAPEAKKAGVGSIRTCVSGAMRLARTTVDAFKTGTGGHVIQGYGMTETSPVVMANPLDGNARHVSVGTPLPSTEARIVDENDPSRILPIGYPGELLIRGPQVFAGYWNQPTETAESLSPDGWFRTGDIAVMSPDGYFTLIDRKRDVIIVDGFNVYPSEVEAVLQAHPAVEEAAVVGVPEPGHGEAVAAYVIPRQAHRPSQDELRAYCAQQLIGYKVPTFVEFRPDLPRNMLGKVLRRVLREENSLS